MGWDRQAPDVRKTPEPIVLGRWFLAACVAVLACVVLFLLHAAERVPPLQALNIWVMASAPLLIWLLIFSARAYAYGSALSHYQFLEEEALIAQESWQNWAQRSLAVHASCVLLPNQVSAKLLMQGSPDALNHSGQAQRISALPSGDDRAQAGLQLLVPALARALQALPAEQELRVTLLNDAAPGQYDALRNTWQQVWASATRNAQPPAVALTDELSFQWIEDLLKTGSAALELILVLQVNGESTYSDGLAALLLCPDKLACAWDLPVRGKILRPMPLSITTLQSELPLFFQTQTSARLASGLLADGECWQPVINEIYAIGGANGASLTLEQQWVQARLCGLTGPFSHWLVAAQGVEMALHQQQPLLLLAKEKSRHWISTVTKRELV
ncbi:hypothetical protein QLG10_29010 [Pseudomonas sp. V98_8]|jgi:hypothetical protein|uniref:hypothetical protein n=1 Tax=Pseudomonas sp. V98_8 TaxID=3044228 RepID=UPI000D83F883|nr:hypothetical protein [Pseudomonas sp. V98_8]MDI3396476.1 hypothetical protein [Pseudomonas sp. V98_8]MDP9692454.1 hypothetical protein [Pseudomonas mohnii]